MPVVRPLRLTHEEAPELLQGTRVQKGILEHLDSWRAGGEMCKEMCKEMQQIDRDRKDLAQKYAETVPKQVPGLGV